MKNAGQFILIKNNVQSAKTMCIAHRPGRLLKQITEAEINHRLFRLSQLYLSGYEHFEAILNPGIQIFGHEI